MKKRMISFLLIICMAITLLPTFAFAASQYIGADNSAKATLSEKEKPFKDVSESDWFYNSIVYVLEHGIFKGIGDDTFSPGGAMTRGMYVTVMGRIAGVDPAEYMRKASFTDVDKDAYYAPYVAWAVKYGITNGAGSNKFNPDGIVNREQMAVFTVRFFNAYNMECGALPEITTTPGDLSGVSEWAKDSVLKLWAAGLLKGDNKGNFNPGFNATRAEVSTFSMRISEMAATQGAVNASPTPTPTPASPTPTPTPGNTDSGSTKYFTVAFESNGGTEVSPVSVARGGTISSLPSPNKADAVFLGWYADSGLQGDMFSEKDAIYSNRTLYAKYLAIEGVVENELDTSFSLPEQDSDLAIGVVSSSGSISAAEVKSGITLEIIDGSEPVSLAVNGSNGVFTVTAIGGFTEGASYKLTLSNERPELFRQGRYHTYLRLYNKKERSIQH